MKLGNKLGVAAVIALALSAVLGFQNSIFELHPHLGIVLLEISTALSVISLMLFVAAGIRGSRWWLAVAVILASGWVFVVSRGV